MSAIVMMTVSATGTLVALAGTSTVGFLAATVVAGMGFGAGFQGGMRTVVPLAAPSERGGLVSVLYVICYLGMAVPSVVAGILVVHGGGLVATACGYVGFVAALALATLAGLIVRRPRSTTAARSPVDGHHLPGAVCGLTADEPTGRG